MPTVEAPIEELELARVLHALSDPVRLDVVRQLDGGGECRCGTFASPVGKSTLSHHLKVLREAGLLDCERRATWVWYRVVPAGLAQLAAVLGTAELNASAAAIPVTTIPAASCPPAVPA